MILIVGGMLLLSIVFLGLASSGTLSRDALKVLIGLACAGAASLVVGAILSNRKR